MFSFVFWSKLKRPKRHFEIIWLLVLPNWFKAIPINVIFAYRKKDPSTVWNMKASIINDYLLLICIWSFKIPNIPGVFTKIKIDFNPLWAQLRYSRNPLKCKRLYNFIQSFALRSKVSKSDFAKNTRKDDHCCQYQPQIHCI